MFDSLPKSTMLRHEGKTRTFPSLADYQQRLIQRGALGPGEDLTTRADLVVEIQKHWHRSGQTGCVFARILSTDPAGNLWRIVPHVGVRAWSAADWNARVRDDARAVIVDPNAWLLSYLFPDVTEPGDLRKLVRRVASLEGWSLVTSGPLEVEGRGVLMNTGLRIELPDAVTSWALGLGPFPFMPFTRQSPFTELIFAVKPKGPGEPLHPELSTDRSLAHVADAPVPIERSIADPIWRTTQANKRLHLRGPNDPTAKAKVTFSFPADVWAEEDQFDGAAVGEVAHA